MGEVPNSGQRLLRHYVGFANKALELLPFVDKGPFNIFSVPGIVWARLMGDGIAYKVMLLTPGQPFTAPLRGLLRSPAPRQRAPRMGG